MSEQLKYPYFPPYDNEVNFYQGSQARINPRGSEKMAKVCPKCGFPIHVLVYMKPCYHYMCYDCYSTNKYQCAFCNRIICEVVRVPDREPLFTSDGKYFQVFQTEEQLKQHQMHQANLEQQTKLIQNKTN